MAALYSLNRLLSTQDTNQRYAFHSAVASFPLQPLAHQTASMNPSSETAGYLILQHVPGRMRDASALGAW